MKILFVDLTKGFRPGRLEEKPTGGIITSLTLIPRYLAARGHEVSVVSEFDQEALIEGVRHLKQPVAQNDFDVVVLNRNMIDRSIIKFFERARKIWWLHDIVDHRQFQDDGYRGVDTIVALSNYCRESYADFYGLPREKFVVIPNGVDKDVFYPAKAPRNKRLFIHASAPIKGTHPLPFTFHNLKRYDPGVELRSYSSQKLHELEESGSMSDAQKAMREAGVTLCDPIPQRDLADVFREAWALLMPNHYPEINSNILLQAKACGLPIVASNIGSASEFLVHEQTGLLTKTTPSDWYWWWKDFAGLAARLQHDGVLHNMISQKAPLTVPSWDDIGEAWHRMLVKEKAIA